MFKVHLRLASDLLTGLASHGLGDEASAGVYPWDGSLGQSKDPQARTALGAAVSGKNVVVLGGGAVAMDNAVTAKRLGADRVHGVSLEAMEELPADEDAKDLGFRVGIRFKPNGRVTRVESENGTVKAVHGVEIRWIEPGRFVPDNAGTSPEASMRSRPPSSYPCARVLRTTWRPSGTGLSASLVGAGLPFVIDPAEHSQTAHVVAKVDEERCVGCLLCRHVCPVLDCVGTAEVPAQVISGMHRDAMDFVPRG